MQTKLWRIYLPPTLKVRSNRHFLIINCLDLNIKKGIYIYFTLLTVVTLSPISRDFFSDIIFDKPSLILIESITCFESMRANVGFNRNFSNRTREKKENTNLTVSNYRTFPVFPNIRNK